MSQTVKRRSSKLVMALLFLAVFSGVMGAPPPEKMKPEEVVAKHLASIGTPEDIVAAKTRIMVGAVKARLKISNSARELSGPAQFASDGNKVLLAMAFNSINYPYDKAGFDGQKVTVSGLPTGGRSQLAAFLASQDAILKQGLIGGTLSSAWALNSLVSNEAKLSYAGTAKVNGREAHKLKYEPKKGNLKISLYFEAETFRHVRSEYEYSVSAYMGVRPGSNQSVPTGSPTGGVSRFQLIEEFSDFQPTGKLTLPHTYKIQLVVDSTAQNLEWTINLSQFVFDQPIDPEAFNVAARPS